MQTKTKGRPLPGRFEDPLAIAARLRNYEYIVWKLRRDSISATDSDAMAMVIYALVWTDTLNNRNCWFPSHEPELDWRFVASLLDQGLIQPHSLTQLQPHVWPSYFSTSLAYQVLPRAGSPIDIEELGLRGNPDFNVTIWDHLLVVFFLAWLAPTALAPSYLGAMLQTFLEHGAGAPTICAYVEVTIGDAGFVEDLYVSFEAEAEDETKKANISYRNDDIPVLTRRKLPGTPFRDVSGWDFEEEEGRKTFNKTFTLRSWVEYCTYEELPNKDRILDILDQKTMAAPQDKSPDFREADAAALASRANGCSKAASDSGNCANGQKTVPQGDNKLPSSEAKTPGGSMFLMASQVRDAHTPSSVFGFLLVILLFMVSVEIAT